MVIWLIVIQQIFTEHLLYPGIILDVKNTAMNQTNKSPASWGLDNIHEENNLVEYIICLMVSHVVEKNIAGKVNRESWRWADTSQGRAHWKSGICEKP